jgi:hypothetical protein
LIAKRKTNKISYFILLIKLLKEYFDDLLWEREKNEKFIQKNDTTLVPIRIMNEYSPYV